MIREERSGMAVVKRDGNENFFIITDEEFMPHLCKANKKGLCRRDKSAEPAGLPVSRDGACQLTVFTDTQRPERN